MFGRSIIWFICISVAVVTAANYSDSNSITGSPTVEAVQGVVEAAAVGVRRPAGTSLPAAGAGGASPGSQQRSDWVPERTTAAPCPKPDEAAVSLLRNLSEEEKDRSLIQAAKEGAVEQLQALLAAGANVQARDQDLNYTALHWAAFWGHADVVRCLLGGGAQVDARNNYQATALHFAAGSGHAAVVRLLVASRADPNATDDEDQTPLHWAAERGYAEVVTALLVAGAEKGARDVHSNTPLDLARQNDYQQLTEILS